MVGCGCCLLAVLVAPLNVGGLRQGNRAARKHILQSLNLSGMLARAGCCLPISCSSRSRRPIVCYFSPKQTRPTRFPFIYFFVNESSPCYFLLRRLVFFYGEGIFKKNVYYSGNAHLLSLKVFPVRFRPWYF